MKLSELVEIAKQHKLVHIAGHEHPDGDCIGASLGLAMLLKECGVEAQVLLDQPSDFFSFMPIDEWVQQSIPEEVDLFITLDTSDESRLSIFSEVLNMAKEVINIDHHASNTHFGNINVVDEYASSTSEMIYRMIDIDGILNKSIAQALYLGIIFDTGCFKHSNTKPSTMHAAADLIRFEFDFSWMINKMFYEKPYKALKVQGIAFERIKLYTNDRIAVSYITHEDFDRMDLDKSHTEGIVQRLNEIEGVEAAIFFYASGENEYKISLRSRDRIDVCEVAQAFGGGGHKKASGAKFNGLVEEGIELVVAHMSKQFQ